MKKQKWMKNPEFKSGDLVTGIDQSYKRSIYRYIESTGQKGISLYEIVSLDGRDYDKERESHRAIGRSEEDIDKIYRRERNDGEFRIATWMEIKRSTTHSLEILVSLLWDLGIKPRYTNDEEIRGDKK